MDLLTTVQELEKRVTELSNRVTVLEANDLQQKLYIRQILNENAEYCREINADEDGGPYEFVPKKG